MNSLLQHGLTRNRGCRSKTTWTISKRGLPLRKRSRGAGLRSSGIHHAIMLANGQHYTSEETLQKVIRQSDRCWHSSTLSNCLDLPDSSSQQNAWDHRAPKERLEWLVETARTSSIAVNAPTRLAASRLCEVK